MKAGFLGNLLLLCKVYASMMTPSRKARQSGHPEAANYGAWYSSLCLTNMPVRGGQPGKSMMEPARSARTYHVSQGDMVAHNEATVGRTSSRTRRRTAEARCWCACSARPPHERDRISMRCAEAGRPRDVRPLRPSTGGGLPRHRGGAHEAYRGDTIILQAVVFDMQVDPRSQLYLGALKLLLIKKFPAA